MTQVVGGLVYNQMCCKRKLNVVEFESTRRVFGLFGHIILN